MKDVVFAGNDCAVFALIDGAAAPKLVKALHEKKPEFCCLYPGELKPDIAAVAPYLVRLEPEKEFTESLLQEGWGTHWGLVLDRKSVV